MINRDNYLKVREFLDFYGEIKQRTPESVVQARRCLSHLLEWADKTHLNKAIDIRPTFPAYLLTRKSGNGHKGNDSNMLTLRSMETIFVYAVQFLKWVKEKYPKEFNSITPDYLASLRPTREAKIHRGEPKKRREVTLDIVKALAASPAEDIASQRNKAAAAFLFLSGMRAAAFVTMPIMAVNIDQRTVKQLPSMGVATKRGKSAVTRLLEIPELISVVKAWDDYLRANFPPESAWFPVIEKEFGQIIGVKSTTKPNKLRRNMLGKGIRRLFESAGIQPMNVHAFRHGHAGYALKMSETFADIKAISQNLMHSNVGITDTIYSVLNQEDMLDRIGRLGQSSSGAADGELAPENNDDLTRIVSEFIKQVKAKR